MYRYHGAVLLQSSEKGQGRVSFTVLRRENQGVLFRQEDAAWPLMCTLTMACMPVAFSCLLCGAWSRKCRVCVAQAFGFKGVQKATTLATARHCARE